MLAAMMLSAVTLSVASGGLMGEVLLVSVCRLPAVLGAVGVLAEAPCTAARTWLSSRFARQSPETRPNVGQAAKL